MNERSTNCTVVYSVMSSPIGDLLLTSEGDAVTGITMELEHGEPAPAPSANGGKTNRPLHCAASASNCALFRGRPLRLRPAIEHRGHVVSTRSLARIARNPLRRNVELRRAGAARRATGRLTRRRRRQRTQPHRHRRAVPSRHRRRWNLDRLWRRPRSQAVVARAREKRTAQERRAFQEHESAR